MHDLMWTAIVTAVVAAIAIYLIVSRYKMKIQQLELTNIAQKEDHLTYKSNAEQEMQQLRTDKENLSEQHQQLNREMASLTSDLRNLHIRIEDFKIENAAINQKLDDTATDRNRIQSELDKSESEIKHLIQKLENEQLQICELNEKFKIEFENLANKILDEKSQKFTTQNQENLNTILKPFQEKIIELKNTVHETYEKENQQRFSLGEKVKELAELNQQISKDARQLTRALKNNSKTQGNWGEMILENILEKSGLVKGREYFMEYQLTGNDKKALLSADSGKKMRPDAVIKYPDERNVIIDAKVSLTAFIDMVDETDADVYEIKKAQHLSSVKNHINSLSVKAYDDYEKSLDFVMMFIPSEAAYIAAVQADPDLWNYAYERRILLMNPGNLITSLKLIADLWKREYQNRNAIEIADRGAKLYDKFVGFIQNMEQLGKNLDQAKSVYGATFKQLHTGKDNLVLQTQKLKDLGLKTKKNLPPYLIEENPEDSDTKDKNIPLA